MAVTLVYSPLWFHGIDIVLEVFSILAAILITIVGYRAYKLTKEKRFFYFAMAFGFITLSFLARAITAITVISQINVATSVVAPTLSYNFIEQVFDFGRFVYFLLVLGAYLILFALSMRIYDKKLLTLLGVFMVLFAVSAFDAMPIIFYLVSFLLLVFIAWNYRENYLEKKSKAKLLTSLAFGIMVFEPLFFMAGFYNQPMVVGAYAVRLIAYLTLLVMLIKVYTKK